MQEINEEMSKRKSKLGSAFGSQRGGPKSASGSVFGEEDLSKNPIPEGFKSIILPNAEQNANEDEKLDQVEGNKSLQMRLTLGTTNSKVSPVIDSQRVSVILTNNRVNSVII